MFYTKFNGGTVFVGMQVMCVITPTDEWKTQDKYGASTGQAVCRDCK